MIFNISESARLRLSKVLIPETHLLISITSGGCNGFSYTYTIVSTIPEESMIVSQSPSVYISNSAKDLLTGGILNYSEDDLGGSFFTIQNPNATSKCGCGNSFSTF